MQTDSGDYVEGSPKFMIKMSRNYKAFKAGTLGGEGHLVGKRLLEEVDRRKAAGQLRKGEMQVIALNIAHNLGLGDSFKALVA